MNALINLRSYRVAGNMGCGALFKEGQNPSVELVKSLTLPL